MFSLTRPLTRAAGATMALSLVCVAAATLTSGSRPARAAASGQLKQQISAGQSHVSGLSTAVRAADSRLSELRSGMSALERQIARLQADLNVKRSALLRLRGELTDAKLRLAHLQLAEAQAANVLSAQLIDRYEADQADIVSVVLEATGFKNLLERLSFAQRIRSQDVHIVAQARETRRALAAQATRFGALGARQQTVTEQALSDRNRLYSTSAALLRQQLAVSQAGAASAGQLASARVAALELRLTKIQSAGAALPASTNKSSSSRVSASGGLVFPMRKADASPRSTWTLDQGVDIAAPGGTPLLAVGSGTIVPHGVGGFGPSAPVLHLDSGPYVYYGHAGPDDWVPIGTHVNVRQVISQVGRGIVGISTGPHLEIGFADSSGSPIGAQAAPKMMALLRAAYAG
jgi:murein DD-endopeptidase MepM/ murein hydrolase activator NlpD